jgi:hypothetical protein
VPRISLAAPLWYKVAGVHLEPFEKLSRYRKLATSSLFFIYLESREIHVAGVTPHPNEAWMV